MVLVGFVSQYRGYVFQEVVEGWLGNVMILLIFQWYYIWFCGDMGCAGLGERQEDGQFRYGFLDEGIIYGRINGIV